MRSAATYWILGAIVAMVVVSACEPKGDGASTAAKGGAPGVKVGSEPMKPEEIAQAGQAPAAAPGQAQASGQGQAQPHAASATLLPATDNPRFSGTVTFTQQGDQVRVVANLAGVERPGNHGFHIHATGQCEHDPGGNHFASAGGHFNPTDAPHGCPDAAAHHAGDLGNVVIGADGSGHVDLTTPMLSLSGPNSVVGKAVILHSGADDCTSQPAGNAGARLACGVVSAGGAAGAGRAASGAH
ncbi:MAG TPA: superoxide dismutase family protein [Thermoanaerobaculia bacterium]|nr:superoxide dismutase family protein [Thermoanaerobaculia bacterium]